MTRQEIVEWIWTHAAADLRGMGPLVHRGRPEVIVVARTIAIRILRLDVDYDATTPAMLHALVRMQPLDEPHPLPPGDWYQHFYWILEQLEAGPPPL